jgi:putative ABC transport system ATP-binding protein
MNDTIVAFEKVSKTYGADGGVRALNEVDLAIGRGTRVAIMGQSGSGKSTLLNIMCGLDEPTSGRMIFEGRDLHAVSDDDRTRLRREKIGMVFQTFNLMPTLTGVENVSLPLRLNGMGAKEAAEKASKMLARVGLTERNNHRPDEMSGGERQRVAIARSLIFNPPVLLADEPTGNLDSRTGDEILHLLDDIHNEFGTTIVLVTHNDDAARHCERWITLRDGNIVEDILRGVTPS